MTTNIRTEALTRYYGLVRSLETVLKIELRTGATCIERVRQNITQAFHNNAARNTRYTGALHKAIEAGPLASKVEAYRDVKHNAARLHALLDQVTV